MAVSASAAAAVTRPLDLARETSCVNGRRARVSRFLGRRPPRLRRRSYVAVDLTPSGTFKYVLLSAVAKDGSRVQLVRGYAGMEYHADVFDAALPAIEASGLTDVTCTGGGRIRHDAGSKLFIYGYSLGFGRADHADDGGALQEGLPILRDLVVERRILACTTRLL